MRGDKESVLCDMPGARAHGGRCFYVQQLWYVSVHMSTAVVSYNPHANQFVATHAGSICSWRSCMQCLLPWLLSPSQHIHGWVGIGLDCTSALLYICREQPLAWMHVRCAPHHVGCLG